MQGQDRIEKLFEDALRQIGDWAVAYPVKLFPELEQEKPEESAAVKETKQLLEDTKYGRVENSVEIQNDLVRLLRLLLAENERLKTRIAELEKNIAPSKDS